MKSNRLKILQPFNYPAGVIPTVHTVLGKNNIHEATGELYRQVRISKVINAKLYVNAYINTYNEYFKIIEGYSGAKLEFVYRGTKHTWVMDRYKRLSLIHI